MSKRRGALREHVEAAIVAIGIALILRLLVIAVYKIPTGSMIPTLKVGDLIFSWKLPYSIPFIEVPVPRRGSVIVFKSPEDPKTSLIKRVVGVPGDRIELRKRVLIVNGSVSHYASIPSQEIQSKEILEGTAADYYQVFEESLGNQKHLVMFRKELDDESFGPQVIPEGHVFVLGDNRDSSDDSRNWGLVPFKQIESQAFLVWLSLDWDRKYSITGWPQIRWSRIFSKIQ